MSVDLSLVSHPITILVGTLTAMWFFYRSLRKDILNLDKRVTRMEKGEHSDFLDCRGPPSDDHCDVPNRRCCHSSTEPALASQAIALQLHKDKSLLDTVRVGNNE